MLVVNLMLCCSPPSWPTAALSPSDSNISHINFEESTYGIDIDPATTIGAVALSVADLQRSLAYYQQRSAWRCWSMRATSHAGRREHQPCCGCTRSQARGLSGGPPACTTSRCACPPAATWRVCFVTLPSSGTRIGGAADHLFSEALYLSDPDGHGIEIYRDRPRDTWYDAQGKLRVASDPLDLQGILRELDGDESPWDGLPVGTDMGHIHLQVANIRDAERFYVEVLGFERMIGMPSASFVSAGGYHHHIGMNTWAGIGVPAPPEGAARLLSYEVVLPNQRH